MNTFVELSHSEMEELNGGFMTATIAVALFVAGFAGGISCGIAAKNR